MASRHFGRTLGIEPDIDETLMATVLGRMRNRYHKGNYPPPIIYGIPSKDDKIHKMFKEAISGEVLDFTKVYIAGKFKNVD